MASKPFLKLSLLLIVCLLASAVVACRGNTGPAATTAPTIVATSVATTTPPPAVSSSDDPSPTPPAPTAVVPTATPAPTEAPPTPTAEPTIEPTPTTPPEPTPTPEPTPEPTATAADIVQPEWLAYLNQFRTMANLPLLQNDDLLSLGSQFHSQYMVKNDAAIAHNQDESNPYYDPAGDQAAENGNIFATSQVDANYVWGMNFWISAPFHLVPILDPRLAFVGFGSFNEAAGGVQMAAVLDVRSAPPAQPDTSYPIFFPADGSSTWVVRNSMFEWPDPLTNCPGFTRPTGAPIVLLLGDGSQQPRIFSHTLYTGDTEIETCLIHETNYRNPDGYAESNGRLILDIRDAVVIIPRQPLAVDETYNVQVVTDSSTYDWSFNTIPKP